MNYKMINKEVLVKPISVTEQKTEGGIFLRTDFEPKTMKGEIVAVAEDCDEDIKVKDIVLFHKFAGSSKTFKDDKLGTLRVIRELDIEAIEC